MRKKHKKINLLVTLLVFMMILSGCMDVRLDFVLKKDGTGHMKAFMAMNQSVVSGDDTTGIDGAFFSKKGDAVSNVEVERVPVEYYKEDMVFVGEEYTFHFMNPLLAFNDISETEELSWIYEGEGVYRLEIPLAELNNDVASEGMADMNTIFKDMGGQITYSFETDYEVLDHNADYIEENTIYIWDLSEDVFSSSPEREFGFLEVQIDLEPSLNEQRRAFEQAIDFDRTHRDFHGKALEQLSYLKGTEEGLELDRELTRVEGAIVYARLLGLEEEIQAFVIDYPDYESGFTDVPEWAKDTINYLHYVKHVNGISNLYYGSDSAMTEAQFTTLILRALGYSDLEGDFSWSASAKKALEIGLYSDDIRDYVYVHADKDNPEFTRRTMSYISYNALFFEHALTGQILYEGREGIEEK